MWTPASRPDEAEAPLRTRGGGAAQGETARRGDDQRSGQWAGVQQPWPPACGRPIFLLMSKLKATLVSSKRLRCGVTAAPQYLSGPDIYAGHVGIPIVLLYRQGLDVAALEAGLLRTLKHYPIICGRVRKDAQGQQLID